MVLTYLKRRLFAGSDHVLENVFGDLKEKEVQYTLTPY